MPVVPTPLPAALEASLREVLPVLARETCSPWWLIGSAALVAWGVPGIDCHDVDLLLSPGDAARVEARWSDRRDPAFVPGNDALFRSHFVRYRGFDLPVEVMGGLDLRVEGGWRPVRPSDRRRLALPCGELLLPSLPAMIEILDAFGRPKDLRKSAVVRRFLATSPALPETQPA